MAEPTNTPMPTAPGTPISATPRSGSPAPDDTTPPVGGSSTRGPSSLVVPVPLPTLAPAPETSSWAAAESAVTTAETLAVPPPPAGAATTASGGRPRVLHIGDPIKYNPATYEAFAARFEVVRPSAEERGREEFSRALREHRWGDFAAIYRPFWGTGGEMGKWDAELISLLPDSVRVFASAGAGFDWADVKLLGEKGIIYCNSGLAAADAVADFAVAMIISTFRAVPYCLSSAASPDTFAACHADSTARSHNLRSQVLGLIGLGNIGQRVASRMRAAFAMEVLYYDMERKSSALEAELGARFVPSLDRLAEASDCVVLCTPAGAGRLVDGALLARFRPGARFVNVARGSLVDEEALADALDAGHLSAIALDVHADEPRVNPRLARHAGSRAWISCHNAGGTVETHAGFEELGMRNITAVLGGGEPITPVNLQYLGRKA